MPSALTLSKSSMRSASVLFFGPRAFSSAMSMSSIRLCLASSIACSAVPPMPMPSMPGGHQPAPIVGTVFSTQSTRLSLGFIILNFDLFSLPPPLAATIDVDRVARHQRHLHHAGVLSLVFLRSKCGSATIDARSGLSGSR